MNREETLAAYIRKLLDVKDEELTESHLKELALELGLSESDYEDLQQVYADHITRGEGFMNHNNWDDAIDELRQAMALNPLQTPGLMLLARAYEGKWRESRKSIYRKEALHLARKVLNHDPDHPEALAFISEVKSKPISTRTIAAFIVLLLAGLAIGGLFFTNISKDQEPIVPQHEPEVAPLSDASPRPADAETLDFSDFEVPVSFYTDRAENLEFIPQTSSITDLGKSHTYQFQGWIKVEKGEIRRLEIHFEVVLENGDKWLESGYTVHDRPAPGARAGDLLPLGISMVQKLPKPDNIREVRVSVSEIFLESAPEVYAPSPPVKINWAKARTEDMQIEVRARAYQIRPQSSYPYALIAYEVENTGTVALSPLQLETRWYDANNHLLHTGSIFVVGPNTPSLAVGETYTACRTYSMSGVDYEKIDTFEVTVIRVGKE